MIRDSALNFLVREKDIAELATHKMARGQRIVMKRKNTHET